MAQGPSSIRKALDLDLPGDPSGKRDEEWDSWSNSLRCAAEESDCRRPSVKLSMPGAQPPMRGRVAHGLRLVEMGKALGDYRRSPALLDQAYQQILVYGPRRRAAGEAVDLMPGGHSEHALSGLNAAGGQCHQAHGPEISVPLRCLGLIGHDQARLGRCLERPGRLLKCGRVDPIASGQLDDEPTASR